MIVNMMPSGGQLRVRNTAKLWYYPYTKSFDFVKDEGRSWDSSVAIVSRLWAGLLVSGRSKDFSLQKRPDRLWGPPSLHTGGFFSRG
jgi:hypothetical protein